MKSLLLVIFCLITLIVKTQNGFTTYTTNLAITGGLKFPKALLVDNSGNKWLGFQTLSASVKLGLLKYDNTNWTLYNQASTPAFPSNYVTSLAQDNNGNIWIGCDSGLVKFNGITFTTYSMAHGLPMKMVNAVEVVGNQVYVSTKKGLSRFDGISFTNYNVANGKLPYDTITCIKAENPNVIWLGSRNHLTEFDIDNTFNTTSYSVNSTVIDAGVLNCIYIDSQNAKWIGTNKVGILKYTGTTFDNANTLYNIIGSIIPNTVVDIAEGIHNGIVFKHTPGNINTPNIYSGLTELATNNKVYQYFYPASTYTLGNFIEKDGSNIIGTISTGFSAPKMYYSFSETNYTVPLGPINTDNFKYLDINNVNAGIANRGDMHWNIFGNNNNNQNSTYEVPKGSGKHSSYISALWVGGLDNTNQLHGAAQNYRQYGNDFWPGPLDTINATIDSATSLNYDKIWKVTYNDINIFINAYNSGSVIATPDMLSWPAHGTGNNSRNLAPFVDHNGDGVYNPSDGDYPKIKGDQALYYIFNDKLSSHQSTFNPMGIEVQGMAYAYGCPIIVNGHNELTYTTFYDYKIINRSTSNYHDVYVSMMSDVDVGYFADDYICSNVGDNYAFGYNADGSDLSSGNIQGYGNYIPAQGVKVLQGPIANPSDGVDNNNDGVVDELNEDCKLSKLIYFRTYVWDARQVLPTNDTLYYRCMNGLWYDGTPITCIGNGYGGNNITNWVYPGDPSTPNLSTDPNNTCGYWINQGLPGSDVMVLSSGPFTLNAGQMQEVEYAFVTSFDSSSTTNSNLLSVAKLKTDIQKVTAFYNQVNKPNCLQAIDVGIRDVLKQNDFGLFPNPAKSLITISSTINGTIKVNYEIVDVLGKVVVQSENTGSDKFSINISDLNSGIYFVRLHVNNSVVVKKFVKE